MALAMKVWNELWCFPLFTVVRKQGSSNETQDICYRYPLHGGELDGVRSSRRSRRRSGRWYGWWGRLKRGGGKRFPREWHCRREYRRDIRPRHHRQQHCHKPVGEPGVSKFHVRQYGSYHRHALGNGQIRKESRIAAGHLLAKVFAKDAR